MNGVNLFVLLFCNLFFLAQQAYFSSEPPRGIIYARIGDDVLFPWNFTLEAKEKLLIMQLDYSRSNLFENSATRIAYRLMDKLSISKDFRGRVHVKRTGALTLRNVTMEQRGFYKCAVSLLDQSKPLWSKAQLLVGIPPVIHSCPASKMTLLEGDHLDISCEASGTPVPNVSWYKQMEHGWKKLSERKLQIKNVKESDSGHYKCSARNFMGVQEKNVELNVYERPTVTSFFHTAALDDTVYECEELTFTCEARGIRPPVKNIYIYHEGRLVHRSLGEPKIAGDSRMSLVAGRKSGQLRIAEVKKENEGKYYCVAENEHGLGYNKTIDLKVFAAPVNCERKRTIKVKLARTTKISSSVSPPTSVDHSVSPTEGQKVLGRSHSGCNVLKPSLLLLLLWICNHVFCRL